MELKKGLCPPDIFLKVESVCLIICWRRPLSTWWHVKKYLAHLMPCKNGLRLTDDLCNGVFFHLKTCYLKNGLCPLEEKERRLNPTKKIEEWSSATSWNSKMVFVNLMACKNHFVHLMSYKKKCLCTCVGSVLYYSTPLKWTRLETHNHINHINILFISTLVSKIS